MKQLKLHRCLIATVTLLLVMSPSAASAANNISLSLDNSVPGAAGVSYKLTWSGYQTASPVKCIAIQYSVNADGTGGMPSNMAFPGTTLTGTYGGSWSYDNTLATSGILVFNDTTGPGLTPAAGPATLIVNNVKNPDTVAGGTYFETVTTYDATGTGTSGSCLGNVLDTPTTSPFVTTPGQATSVTIDPAISLTVNTVGPALGCGDTTTTVGTSLNTIDFGHITAITQHAIAGQKLNVTTNAAGGYTVYVSYSGALMGQASGHAYNDHAGSNGAPTPWGPNGTEAFGYTTESSTLSGTPGRFHTDLWAPLTTGGAELMHNPSTPGPTGDDSCIAYQVSEAGNTPADYYSTTVRYNAVGVF